MDKEPKEQTLIIYKDKKGEAFYNATYCPDVLPAYHKFLMWFHLCYLFLLPSASMVLTEMYFGGTPFFRLTGWLILAIYLGFTINNYKIPVNKNKAAFMVLNVPLSLIFFSLLSQREWVFQVIELAFIELISFFIALLIATIFRAAPITLLHRLFSFIIVFFLTLAVISQFPIFKLINFGERNAIYIYLLIIPFAAAIYNNAQLFLKGEFGGEEDVNLGTSILSEKFSPIIALFAIIWLLLPSIGKALS